MKNTIKAAFDAAEKEIESIRYNISKVQSEIEQVSIARVTTNEAKENIVKFLDHNAESYKGFDEVVNHSLAVEPAIPITRTSLIKEGSHLGQNITPFLCCVFYDDFKKILFQKIDDKKIPEGLPQKEREKHLDNLKKELWNLGVKEENLICEAEESGYYIQRRRFCDPKIVLEYQEVS